MAMLIYIKKRADPIEVSYERGMKVKALWVDTENVPRDTIIDLGDPWSGEVREIKMITQGGRDEKTEGLVPVSTIDDGRKKIEDENDRFRKLPVAEKVKLRQPEILQSYSFAYKMDTGREPEEKLIREVKIFVEEYFHHNPDSINVPRDLIKQIR